MAQATFIIEYWVLWIIGLILFPLIITLIQLANIRYAIDKGDKEPQEVAKRFLEPIPLSISIILGIATFVCFVLFLAAVLVGIVASIKALFA